MRSNFEIITTTDKAQRDVLFAQLRNSEDQMERRVVKFSGVQPVLAADGAQALIALESGLQGLWESTWSMAYPKVDTLFVEEDKQRHGSKRNPRVFPGRKKAA